MAIFAFESSIVRDTIPGAGNQGGSGLQAIPHWDTDEPAALTVERSVVERNVELGIFVSGGSLSVDSSVVRDTAIGDIAFGGRGIVAVNDAVNRATSTLMVTRSNILFPPARSR